MSESDSDDDQPNFFSAAADDDDEEEEVTFPVSGVNEDEGEDGMEEVAEEIDLGSPLYVVFNRSWFSVPRVARTSTVAGVVRCYDRPVVVDSAERMGALILDHKSWPTREALLDLVAADQVVVLQGNFKDDPTLRYVWGIILTTGTSVNTEDHRIFRTLPKRVYGELLSAYSKDAELVGSSLLDMESTDNNSRSFNPTICGWQRVTLEGFPRTAAVTPSKDVTADKLPKPSAKKVDPKVGTIFDSRPSAGSASTDKLSATTPVAVTRKPAPMRKPTKKAGAVAEEDSKSSNASTALTVVTPTAMALSAAAKTKPVPATVTAERASVKPTSIMAPVAPSALPTPPFGETVATAPGLRLGDPTYPPNLPNPSMSTDTNVEEINSASNAMSKKRKLTEIFDVAKPSSAKEELMNFTWPPTAHGAKVTIEYYFTSN